MNDWIIHTKQFAEQKGIKYHEALKDPENKATYRMKKQGKGVADEMGTEQRLLATAYNKSQLGANAGKNFISL